MGGLDAFGGEVADGLDEGFACCLRQRHLGWLVGFAGEHVGFEYGKLGGVWDGGGGYVVSEWDGRVRLGLEVLFEDLDDFVFFEVVGGHVFGSVLLAGMF